MSHAEDDPKTWNKTFLQGNEHPMYCHPENPLRCVIRVNNGEKVPFSGILQTFQQSAELSVRADPELQQRRVEEAVETAKKLGEAEVSMHAELRKIEASAHEKITEHQELAFQDALKKARPDWFERPLFVAIVTAVSTLGVITLSVWAAGQFQDKLSN